MKILPLYPSSEQLAAFALGLLGEAESAEIEAHLAGCTACSEQLDAVPDDVFIRRLRASAGRPGRGLWDAEGPGAVQPWNPGASSS